MMSAVCAETHSLSFSVVTTSGAPAPITKMVMRYEPLKPFECIPAQIARMPGLTEYCMELENAD